MPHLLKNGDSKWLTAALPCMVYCGSTKRLAEGCCLLPHQRFTVTPLEAVHHCAILRHTCTIKRKVKTSSHTAIIMHLGDSETRGACTHCSTWHGCHVTHAVPVSVRRRNCFVPADAEQHPVQQRHTHWECLLLLVC